MVRNQVVSVGLFWILFSIFGCSVELPSEFNTPAGAAGEGAGGSESSGEETPSPGEGGDESPGEESAGEGRCARSEL